MTLRLLTITSVFAFILSPGSKGAGNDTLSAYEVRADMKAFMCPYLSPMYMKMIEHACDCAVEKTDDLVIHVYCRKLDDMDEKRLLELADRTGYQREIVHITKTK